jgi:hypothetical protein
MLSSNDINEQIKLAISNQTSSNLIINNIDYENVISKFKSLQETITYFRENTEVSFTNELIIEYFFATHKDYTNDDLNLAKGILHTNNDRSVTDLIHNYQMKNIADIKKFMDECKQSDKLRSDINKFKTIEYDINETSETINFNVSTLDGDKLNLDNISTIFDDMNPSKKIQIIIYVNPDKKPTYKVNSQFPVSSIDKIMNYDFNENTIIFVHEKNKVVKYVEFNFVESTCSIEIYKDREKDNLQFYVENIIKDNLKLKPITEQNIISGEIKFKTLNSSFPYIDMYVFFMLDKFSNEFFKVDERENSWFSTKQFKLRYFSLNSKILKSMKDVNIYPYVVFNISSIEKSDKFLTISFSCIDIDIIKEAISDLGRILTYFETKENKIHSLSHVSQFHSTILFELKDRVNFLIEDEESNGKSYTTVCSGTHPINIKTEEIESYTKSGRIVKTLNFNNVDYHFTCVNNIYQYIYFIESETNIKSGNTKLPCCSQTKIDEKQKSEIISVKNSTAIHSTQMQKEYGVFSILESVTLGNFIKTSFNNRDMKIDNKAILIGTCFFKTQISTMNNSLIGAMLIATNNKIENNIVFNNIVREIKIKLIQLPYEIYAQELYDIDRKIFIKNMSDDDHFIDPYLYYRGLEEIFNVNIVVFTSDKGRKNPSSLSEDLCNDSTIEIPRCKNYHTRRFLNRPTICIFKNYGSNKTLSIIPCCELIAMYNNVTKETIKIFDNKNEYFLTSIMKQFENVCKVYHFENDITYSDIFSYWDPNTLGFGFVRGQELDIYGRTKLLIYDNYNIIVPSIQPLVLPVTSTEEYKYKGFNYYLSNQGVNKRAKLISKKECIEKFEVTEYDDEGCWIEFQGNPKGIKILTENDNRLHPEKFDNIKNLLKVKNDISALMQLINWLWRSDIFDDYMEFKEWFPTKVEILENDLFMNVGKSRKFLNNLYLPDLTELHDHESRIKFCTHLWPFFFRHKKIQIYKELYDRILNMMKIQDQYTRFIVDSSIYKKIPKFITDLIPTESDFDSDETLIFTEDTHLKMWINYINPELNEKISMNNMNIINGSIDLKLQKTLNPYLYKDEIGKIYIIQNIYSRSFENSNERVALEIAYQWKISGINYGSYKDEITIPNGINYVIMGISKGKLIPTFVSNRESNDYLILLKYNETSYASVLPLL